MSENSVFFLFFFAYFGANEYMLIFHRAILNCTGILDFKKEKVHRFCGNIVTMLKFFAKKDKLHIVQAGAETMRLGTR